MKRNLFVCHTQAQLALACGLVLNRFNTDNNILFLFLDFAIKPRMKNQLDVIFNKTEYLQSIYPAKFDTFRSKIFWYRKDLKIIKTYFDESFDRVFESIDTIYPEQMILKYANKANAECEMSWLEDGITAYYQNVNHNGGLDSNKILRYMRKFLFKYFLGVGKYYNRDFHYTGGNSKLKQMYCLYPKAVREPYMSLRNKIEITNEEFVTGLNSIYDKVELDLPKNVTILVLDKINTYIHPNIVIDVVKKMITKEKTQGRMVYYKLHPRENQLWDFLSEHPSFDKALGIESLYLSLIPWRNTAKIIGIKSTGLMSASKLGYDTYTLFSYCGENNENIKQFFATMNIKEYNF